MQVRGDSLFTSFLSLGEVLAGVQGSPQKATEIRENFSAMNVQLVSFEGGAVDTFASLRGMRKLATADSIHLACAATKGIDLFLTGDRQLAKQIVPGIQFISSIENSPI
jgi:predicted nucleic acid-binding protein